MSKETDPLSCPRCASHKVVPIVYGLMEFNPRAVGKTMWLGGCCIAVGSSPAWHCSICAYEWGIYREE